MLMGDAPECSCLCSRTLLPKAARHLFVEFRPWAQVSFHVFQHLRILRLQKGNDQVAANPAMMLAAKYGNQGPRLIGQTKAAKHEDLQKNPRKNSPKRALVRPKKENQLQQNQEKAAKYRQPSCCVPCKWQKSGFSNHVSPSTGKSFTICG